MSVKLNESQWARSMLEENTVILDTETTGLHDGEIVQIAVIEVTGAILYNQLIKPVYSIPPDATRIHGITDDMVKDALSWSVFAPSLAEFLSTVDNLVIYNATYDRKMMHQSGEKAGIPKIDWKTLTANHCAMLHYASFYGELNHYRGDYKWHKLETACAQQKIDTRAIPAPAHSALGDCLRTLALIKAMAAHK